VDLLYIQVRLTDHIRQTRYILSKDNCFDQSGIGKETKIQYYADYDFYKHWLLRAKAKNPTWVDRLFATWNEEIFSHHNKTVRKLPDGEGETIELVDDAEEIARDMEDLDIGIDAFTEMVINFLVISHSNFKLLILYRTFNPLSQ
jgi:hypothetical protein